jgi:hypothetical protein
METRRERKLWQPPTCQTVEELLVMLKILRDMWGSLEQSGRVAMMVLLFIAALLLIYWGYGSVLLGLL